MSNYIYQTYTQDAKGVESIKGVAEQYDLFGFSLATGDFNGNGADDLAIGAPGDSVGDIDGAGVVNVIYGTKSSSTGLTSIGNQIWHQNTPGVNYPLMREVALVRVNFTRTNKS